MVPNFYAAFAWNDTALADHMAFQTCKSSLTGKEREIVNLIAGEINDCDYCRRADSAIAKGRGFTDSEILEIRKADISVDFKFTTLGEFVKQTVL